MTKRYLVILLSILLGLFMWTCSDPEEDDTTAPGAPLNLAYNANLSGDGQIYISWEAPADDDVVSYHIYRDSGTGSFSEVVTITELFYLDTGLDYTIEYTYKVTAKDDSDNESPFSNEVSLTPLNLLSPDTPTGLEIAAHNIPDDFEVNIELTWLANSETDFAYYKIFRSDVTPIFLPDDESLLDSVTSIFFIDEAVTPGRTYHYKLVAYDLGHKASDPTIVVSDTPLEVPTLIRPIDDVQGTSLTPTFEWQNVSQAEKYRIIVRTSSNTGDIWDTEIEATTANTVSITYPSSGATALSANTRYWWFVAGYSQTAGEINVYSDDTTFRTQ
ncbi:MAG: hypothetical protein U9Q77_00785 [Candidatus Marinimicrobia bacterium]|nr:hypothetical protein [Candidatus Neomarinimicrobiota bacterium]